MSETNDRGSQEVLGKKILQNSRNELYLDFPYLDGAFASLEYEVDDSISTIGTDGEKIYFNPVFLLKKYVEDPVAVRRGYLHMLLHCLYLHIFMEPEESLSSEENLPESGEEPETWNRKCDFFVENLINEACEKRVCSSLMKATDKKNTDKNLTEQKKKSRWKIPVMKKKIQTEAEFAYVFEPQEYVAESINPTVFLGSETNEIIGELRYEGDGNEQNIKINAPVFLIGNHNGEVDGKICDDTVSRIHAKITIEDGCYYMEDMNSTNGTYHNGELLNYMEKVKLEKNDRIVFSKEAYRFV